MKSASSHPHPGTVDHARLLGGIGHETAHKIPSEDALLASTGPGQVFAIGPIDRGDWGG